MHLLHVWQKSIWSDVNNKVVKDTLRITEIFHSLQGETSKVGLPTVFIRLTGCPLRCIYCDSAYAFYGGDRKSFDEILSIVESYETKHVTVTGGEPLAQPQSHDLIKKLLDNGFYVSLETSGAMPIGRVDTRTHIVLDLKTPSSGEVLRNLYENIALLKDTDEVKFVIGDRTDYEWAKGMIEQHALDKHCQVLLSPIYKKLNYETLANWQLSDKLNARMQIQLHKIIWGDVPGK